MDRIAMGALIGSIVMIACAMLGQATNLQGAPGRALLMVVVLAVPVGGLIGWRGRK